MEIYRYEGEVINFMKKKFYVYKWVDSNENILYVGKTIDISNRTTQHIQDKKWIDNDTEIYYAELPNKTDMDIYEIYYINKYNPKYNIRYMNESIFSLTLPELNFKLYKRKNKYNLDNPKSFFFKEATVLNKNETGEALGWLYMEINDLNNFKVKNSYLYEVIKDYHYDFAKLIYDLCAGFEERDNKIFLNKNKTLYFNSPKFDLNMLSLFKQLEIFDIKDNYYVFEEDIISYKYFERLKENAIIILKNRDIDLVEIDYIHTVSTFINPDNKEYMFKNLEDYKEFIKKLN